MLLVRDGLRFWHENQKKYDCEKLDAAANEQTRYYSHDATNDINDDESSSNPQVAITRMLSHVKVDDECYHMNLTKLAELEKQCFSILKSLDNNKNKENQSFENSETNQNSCDSRSNTKHDKTRITMIDEEKMRILGTNKKHSINTNINHIMKCDRIPYSTHVAVMREDCTPRPLWK